jgi:glycosyltransferase involved in cell wall biosynthesis
VVPVRDRHAQGVTRLALLTEIPAPYRIPLFNALAARVDLDVAFLREQNPRRPYYDLHVDELEFAWRVLPGFDVTVGGRWIVVTTKLGLDRPDVVLLGGWNQPAFWRAFAYAKRTRTPCAVWVESTHADERFGWFEGAKQRLLRHVDAFIVPGEASRRYVLDLGVPEQRIVVAPNAVDSTIFAGGTRTRADGPVQVLAVGRLAPEKGLDTLLAAAAELPVAVMIVGSGPEEARLRALAGPNVTFAGEVGRDALPDLYANADVIAMPSRSDPWGMVLNEGAAAGRPLVSTSAAGAAYELIEDGVNGFRVPPDDVAALRAALERLATDDPFRAAAGARSRELAGRFTADAWADAVTALAHRLDAR